MKELGQYLKTNREKQKLSLEDVAFRTKMHIQQVIDIEGGNKEGLPAKVFTIGLIKSYARELKLDMVEVSLLCSKAFQEKMDTSESDTSPPETTSPKVSDDSEGEPQMLGRFQVPKVVMVAASGILSLVLLFAIMQIVEKMNAYSQEEALPKEIFTIDGQDVTDENALSDDDLEQTNLETSVENSPIEVQEKTKQENTPPAKLDVKKPVLQDAVETVKVAKPTPGPKIVSGGEDFSEDNFGETESSAAKEKTTVVVSDNKLILTALEPVRAEVVWSDGYVQVMLLKSQETKTLVFSQPITLRVNNGGAIQVSFNDSEKTVPGTFNKPLEKTYP